MIENLTGYHGNREGKISEAWSRGGFVEEGCTGWVGCNVSLEKMGSKDIPDRGNNISKVVDKEIISGTSGSFKNGQLGEVIHHDLEPCFYSVGQFSQCVQSNPSVFHRSFRRLRQQKGGWGWELVQTLNPNPGTTKFLWKFYLRYLQEDFQSRW